MLNTRPKLLLNFVGIFGIASCLWAGRATAEDVRWPTYYPSPAGVYRSLNSTGQAQFARTGGSVTLAEGGRVGIGSATPAAVLDVRTPPTGAPAAADGLHTGVFVNTNGGGVGVALGSYTTGGVPLDAGSISAFPAANNLVLNPAGRSVLIGAGSRTTETLVVRGTGTIGVTRGANTGELKVAYSGGDYYAVFAP